MKKKLIFFDVETNGINKTDSVLSISAIKVEFDDKLNTLSEIDRYNKFYYLNDGELPNEKAISVNGLTPNVISKRREETYKKYGEYSRNFKDDIVSFYNFCEGSKHFIAHNIKFDREFLPFALQKQFDTMIENIEIVKIPNTNGYSKYKWPKLIECAKHYNIELNDEMLHQSMYDVIIMVKVFQKMFENSHRGLLQFINE